MTKHTPKPWHKDGLSVIAEYEQDGNRHHCHVADATQRNPMREPSIEEHANARLIAAAPDLLAALKNFMAGVSTGAVYVQSEEDERLVNAFAQIRAAIAKAEGKE